MHDTNWARRVKLQQLRAVVAVAENKSLVRAADAMGLSQPAITKIIHDLETDLGVTLFERTSKGTHATAVGDLLTERARLVFSQLEQAAQEIGDAHAGLTGHLTVGTLPVGGANILPRAVTRLHETLPKVRVTVLEGTYDTLVPQLRQGELEMIVGRLPGHRFREGMQVEAFYQEQVSFVVRPGHPLLAQEQPPSLVDLHPWPWVMPLPGTTLRQLIEAAFHDLNLDLPPFPVETLSVITNRRIIMETDYIGVFPSEVIRPEIESGLVSRIPVAPDVPFGPVGVVAMKDLPRSRAAKELLQHLRAVAIDR